MTDRQHGLRGLKRHTTPDPKVAATAPVVPLNAPPEYDATQGRTSFGMQGNATWANCFWAALVHCRTVQAIVSVVNGVTKFVEGFHLDGPNAGVEFYNDYQRSQGQTVQAPGLGTDPYSGTTLMLEKGWAKYAGVLGPASRDAEGNPYFDPALVAECIYDFQGGVIFMVALDADAEQEFDAHVAWGTLSSTPDLQDGHAISAVKYQANDPIQTVVTWGALEEVLEVFEIKCLEGLVLVITEGFILKNGQAAADALVAKWQLQTSPTVTASSALTDASSLTRTVVLDAEHATEFVLHGVDDVQHHLKRLEAAVTERVAVTVVEDIVKDLLKSYTHGKL